MFKVQLNLTTLYNFRFILFYKIIAYVALLSCEKHVSLKKILNIYLKKYENFLNS